MCNMSYTYPAHVDSILLRKDNFWSVRINMDVDLVLLPGLRVEMLEHTTTISQCLLMEVI